MDENPKAASSARLSFYEVVRFESEDPEFLTINGRIGHVAGKGVPEDDEVAVYFYDLERVWCVPADQCISLGRIDQAEKAHSEWALSRIAEKYRRQ